MKKLIIYTLVSMMLMTAAAQAADTEAGEEAKQQSEKIEVLFKLGDDTLNINGKDVQVEKPFENNGTTLVPLRVITEAFGALVKWNDADQSIVLSYGDVQIKLVVDSKDAIVDGKTVTILEAPTVVNDKTMVPLRFITENFGADVSFDSNTGKVSVVKEIAGKNSIRDYALLLKKTTKDRVGDSFYSWSINLPKKVKITDRNFSGTGNDFEADDESYGFFVLIYSQRDRTLDSIMSEEVKNAEKYTILAHGKETKNGTEYGKIAYKSTESIYEHRFFIKNKRVYMVGLFINDLKKYKDTKEFTALLDSFSLDFSDKSTTEDLSDVTASGTRHYEDKKLNWSIDVLPDWYESKSENKENSVNFYETGKDSLADAGQVWVDMYSVEDGLTLEKWIADEKKTNGEDYNPELVKINEAKDITVSGVRGKAILKVMEIDNKKMYDYQVYVMDKKYRYHMGYYIPEASYSDSVMKLKVEAMINSFKFSEPDAEEVGQLIDPDQIKVYDSMRKVEGKEYKWSAQLPTSFSADEDNTDKKVLYYDKDQDIMFMLNITEDAKFNIDDYAEYYEKNLNDKLQSTVKNERKDSLKEKNVSARKYVNSMKYNNRKYKQVYYVFIKDEKLYEVNFLVPEYRYGTKNIEFIKSMWDSMKFE